MEDITSLVSRWQKVTQQRKELDDLSKQLKEGPEAEYRQQIMMYLTANKLTGLKTSDGTIGVRTTRRVEITDLNKMCDYMLKSMETASAKGMPADALLFQKTAHKTAILDLLFKALGRDEKDGATDEELSKVAEELGCRVVSKADISFTKGVKK